jgi:hypothetical protein
MTNKVYCYHCMSYHRPEEMRQIATRSGIRWRCIQSLDAARASATQRDAFGELQSASNRQKERYAREHSRLVRQCLECRCC